jgi:uncharacterized membrane protein
MMLAFWGGLILFGVWAVRMLAGGGTARQPGGVAAREDGAMAMARERYARGEIDRERFEQIRDDLSA